MTGIEPYPCFPHGDLACNDRMRFFHGPFYFAIPAGEFISKESVSQVDTPQHDKWQTACYP